MSQKYYLRWSEPRLKGLKVNVRIFIFICPDDGDTVRKPADINAV